MSVETLDDTSESEKESWWTWLNETWIKVGLSEWNSIDDNCDMLKWNIVLMLRIW